MSGTVDLVVAGGVQKMTQFPILSGFTAGEPFGAVDPWTGSQGWRARYGDLTPSQFVSAEMIAERWAISREQMEQFALRSHERAITAQDNGWFDNEIVRFAGLAADEGPRRDTTLEKMAALAPLSPGGRVTAASEQPDLRCVLGHAHRLGAGGEGPRSNTPGAGASHDRSRRRSGDHAHRADPGD